MKPIKCMLGMHDWEVVKHSDTYYWIPDLCGPDIPAKKYAPEISIIYSAKDRVCLQCGECDHGIKQCEEAYNRRVAATKELERQKQDRKKLAEDLYKFCDK